MLVHVALIACRALKQYVLFLLGEGSHGNHLILITLSTLSAFVNRSVALRNHVNEMSSAGLHESTRKFLPSFFILISEEHFPVIRKGIFILHATEGP